MPKACAAPVDDQCGTGGTNATLMSLRLSPGVYRRVTGHNSLFKGGAQLIGCVLFAEVIGQFTQAFLEVMDDRFNHHFRCHLASGMATHSIADDEESHVWVAKNAVLVVLPSPTYVGCALSE